MVCRRTLRAGSTKSGSRNCKKLQSASDFGDKISLFLQDWKLVRVALGCHMALDMVCQDLNGIGSGSVAAKMALCHSKKNLLSPWTGFDKNGEDDGERK